MSHCCQSSYTHLTPLSLSPLARVVPATPTISTVPIELIRNENTISPPISTSENNSDLVLAIVEQVLSMMVTDTWNVSETSSGFGWYQTSFGCQFISFSCIQWHDVMSLKQKRAAIARTLLMPIYHTVATKTIETRRRQRYFDLECNKNSWSERWRQTKDGSLDQKRFYGI